MFSLRTLRCDQWLSWVVVMLALGCPGWCWAQAGGLAELVSKVDDKGRVDVEAGTYAEPLTIDKALRLVGADRDRSVLEVTSDQPAVLIATRKPVLIEGLTIKWQLETSQGSGPASALFAKDGNVTIRNCRFVALGGGKRCPAAITGDGFSKIKIENCEFDGFEFTLSFQGGAEATVSDSMVINSGRCGLTVGADSKLDVSGCIVARSKYHGVRCTGGILHVRDSLIIENQNRGIYLGNKSAKGTIRNNVIMKNTTGISGFAQSSVSIQNNLILDSEFAGLDTRASCRLKIKDNLFAGNAQGVVLFEPQRKSSVVVGKNSFWNNESNSKDLKLPASIIEDDPQFGDQEDGDFSIKSEQLLAKKQGLTKPQSIQKLWQKWQAANRQEEVASAP